MRTNAIDKGAEVLEITACSSCPGDGVIVVAFALVPDETSDRKRVTVGCNVQRSPLSIVFSNSAYNGPPASPRNARIGGSPVVV